MTSAPVWNRSAQRDTIIRGGESIYLARFEVPDDIRRTLDVGESLKRGDAQSSGWTRRFVS